MAPDSLAGWSFALQIVQTLLIPAMIGAGRFLWKLDRRLYAIEVELNMHHRVKGGS